MPSDHNAPDFLTGVRPGHVYTDHFEALCAEFLPDVWDETTGGVANTYAVILEGVFPKAGYPVCRRQAARNAGGPCGRCYRWLSRLKHAGITFALQSLQVGHAAV